MLPPFFILGPTASGKTALAVEVAERCGGEIIGADAFQVYEGLGILTAQPPPEIRARVRHHLIGEESLTKSFDVAQYATEANRRMAEIEGRDRRVLVVGGTGLYVRALTHGLADLPPGDPAIRSELETLALTELEARLRRSDPIAADWIDLKNRRRVIRALEVCLLTGHPFSSFREEWKKPRIEMRGVILTCERTKLNERIARRTVAMFEQGVVDEVRRAGPIGPTAGQAIGLREITALLAGEISREDCMQAIQQGTRRYAKRQITWFRREPTFPSLEFSETTNLNDLASQLAALIH